MATELIITEKPKQAAKIAYALSDGKPSVKKDDGVSYFTSTFNGKSIIVASAVGHLYGLKEAEKNKWKYPVFNIEWAPSYNVDKKSAHTKKYITVLEHLGKKAKEITVATDYDIEGELIGYNVVRFACNAKDANRMKFSTLTTDELREAYKTKKNTIDWGQALAGETRHKLDWYYGINVSRALTKAMNTKGVFRILSSGRVQGPALKIIVDRELEIRNFVTVPFWRLKYTGNAGKSIIIGFHKEDKFQEKEKVDKINSKCKGKDGIVDSYETAEKLDYAPFPFDLTKLQTEAYRWFGINPSKTLSIAQNLYLGGYISYPRTSSQELPFSLNLKSILKKLCDNPNYKDFAGKVLKFPKIVPMKGKKTDPAHPAIHPTGIMPEKITPDEGKIYDLIVKRFISCFCPPAKRLSQKIIFLVADEPFVLDGISTIDQGWYPFNLPYVKVEESTIPILKKGDKIKYKDLETLEDHTKPNKRFTPASIVSELSKRNLGTKATRANIIDILYSRNYVKGQQIEATELGIKTVETLQKYLPEILDEELTRSFEEEMEKIKEGKDEEIVLEKAQKLLTNVLEKFKKKEEHIGTELLEANAEAEKKESLAVCPVCKQGNLIELRSKKNRQRFIACDRYPDCKTTFSIPQIGKVTKAENACIKCGFPMVKVFVPKIKRYNELCLNPACESNRSKDEGKDCPKCGKGKLVIKTSKYGRFLACDQYPECKHVQKL